METPEQTPERITLFDAIRGVAVLGMIGAHTLFFLHDGTSSLLNRIQQSMNMTVFTVFVFVSGLTASYWQDLHANKSPKDRTTRLLHRTGYLYFGYVITALVALFSQRPPRPLGASFQDIPGILTLFSPPNFTEYIPLFIILTMLFIPLQNTLARIKHSLLYIIVAGTISYVIGMLLYPTSLPPGIHQIKELFAGSTQALRFPVLFYLPVYLLGAWWKNASTKKRAGVMIASLLLVGGSTLAWETFSLSWINPGTRWPPSPGYLGLGICVFSLLFFALPLATLFSWTKSIYQFIVHVGRDAFDLWIIHLVLLFGFVRVSKQSFRDEATVFLAFVLLLSVSIILTNLVGGGGVAQILRVGPLGIAVEQQKRTKKTLILLVCMVGILFLGLLNRQSAASLYGNSLTPREPPTPTPTQTAPLLLSLTSDASWYVRWGTRSDTITLSLRATGTSGKDIPIDTNRLTVLLNDTELTTLSAQEKNGQTLVTMSAQDILPGEYTLSARLRTDTGPWVSEGIPLFITEPLLVAWTFDWEGWDTSDASLEEMRRLGQTYGAPLTHFVSPRTFLPGVLTEARRQTLIRYLQARELAGDEIAMHLHMHNDFVETAGVKPKTSRHWGLRSDEGYDVPTTEYSPQEFETLVTFGLRTMRNTGLPQPQGYRAGGWFLNTPQLSILSRLGFLYDSSGRERPSIGAFRTVPWKLPPEGQPYFPNVSDQNRSDTPQIPLLEIPNNAGNTYEFTEAELTKRIETIYPGGVLEKPKSLVFVSHPQFAGQEFTKISPIFANLAKYSSKNNAGPVVFVRMSDIYALWEYQPQ